MLRPGGWFAGTDSLGARADVQADPHRRHAEPGRSRTDCPRGSPPPGSTAAAGRARRALDAVPGSPAAVSDDAVAGPAAHRRRGATRAGPGRPGRGDARADLGRRRRVADDAAPPRRLQAGHPARARRGLRDRATARRCSRRWWRRARPASVCELALELPVRARRPQPGHPGGAVERRPETQIFHEPGPGALTRSVFVEPLERLLRRRRRRRVAGRRRRPARDRDGAVQRGRAHLSAPAGRARLELGARSRRACCGLVLDGLVGALSRVYAGPRPRAAARGPLAQLLVLDQALELLQACGAGGRATVGAAIRSATQPPSPEPATP